MWNDIRCVLEYWRHLKFIWLITVCRINLCDVAKVQHVQVAALVHHQWNMYSVLIWTEHRAKSIWIFSCHGNIMLSKVGDLWPCSSTTSASKHSAVTTRRLRQREKKSQPPVTISWDYVSHLQKISTWDRGEILPMVGLVTKGVQSRQCLPPSRQSACCHQDSACCHQNSVAVRPALSRHASNLAGSATTTTITAASALANVQQVSQQKGIKAT